MRKKAVKKSKILKKSKKNSLFKEKLNINIRWSYIIYILILMIFSAKIVVDIVAADDYEFRGCNASSCNECAEYCKSCDWCVEKIDKDDSPEMDKNATEVEKPEPPECQPVLSVSSTSGAETFTYTFRIVSCRDGTASVYIVSNETRYIYQNRPMQEWSSVSGSGIRSASEEIREVCVNFNGEVECS